MMKPLFRSLVVATTLTLAFGCVGVPGPTAGVVGVQAPGVVTVKGRVALRAQGYRLAQPSVTFGPYTGADISEIKVYLQHEGDAETDLGTLPSADAAIELRNLKHDAAYSVRLEAWTTVEGNPVRIDTQDGDCVTALTTTNDDLLVDQRFVLKLVNRTYPGAASGSLNLTAGDIEATGEAEQVTAVDPPFVPVEPPPCDPLTDPTCPGYVPPCDALTDPTCPGYVPPPPPCDPLTDPTCPGYVPPCNPLTDPTCPGYVPPPFPF